MSDQATPASTVRPLSRRELEARIVAKAWRDPEFKKHLLENPHAAMQAEVSQIDPSIVLPAALKVHVHEETPNVYHFVLPRNPRDISLGEILGDHLEALAPQTVAIITTATNSSVVSAIQTVVGNVVGVNNFNANTVGNIVVVGNVVVVSGVSAAAVTNTGVASSWATIAASATLANSVASSIA